jgi:hypothetical protein
LKIIANILFTVKIIDILKGKRSSKAERMGLVYA